MRRAAAAFVLLVATLPLGGRAQSRSIVEGRVVSAATGDPLRNARVVVTSAREVLPFSRTVTAVFHSPRPAMGPAR